MKVVVERCLGCAACAAVCPKDALTISGGKPEFGPECDECGVCAKICPMGAIKIEGE
ncbi:DUF362 domain-containing protein [Methanopyrus sp.]